uniref:leucine-rich repeat protein n=1 Tax=Faecalibacterium sp. TaxID=1971605 RepID=UPI003FF104AD
MRPKRLISLLVAVCMMITMLPLSAVTAFAADTASSTEQEISVGDYKYAYTVNADGSTATITRFLGPVDPAKTPAPYDIDIPEKLDGYTVTGLGKDSFSIDDLYSPLYEIHHTKIHSVTIPQSVTSIGDSAFAGCKKLDSLTINDAATSIGRRAFAECPLTTTLELGENITTIGNSAFYDCRGLKNVTIPQSVTSIGDSAFGECSSLETLSLGENIKTIGDSAFYHCINLGKDDLTSVTIPQSVTSIGKDAFRFCNNMKSLTINGAIESMGARAFAGCISLKTLSLGENIKRIGHFAFADCSSLTNVTIPQSVTSIGNYAFRYCTLLKNVTIPEKVTTIGLGTFSYCKQLEYIMLPAGLTSFRDSLEGCPAGCVIYYKDYKTAADALRDNNPVLQEDIRAGHNFLYLCKVTFDANGGSLNDSAEMSVYKTEKINANDLAAIHDPTRTGYKFTGWYTDDNQLVDVNKTEIMEDITLYAHWESDPNAPVCHPLTLKDGVITSVTVPGKNGADPEDITEIVKKNANEDGSFHVPEGATVSVAFDKDAFADSGLKFGHWDITGLDDPNAYQNKESFDFEMPAKAVTLKAMTQDASIEDDGPNVLGTAAIIGTAAVGGAVLGYQAYSLGAEFAGKLMALPYFPSNRSALAMMLWEDAGKPMPESELLYPDVEQEEQDMDMQHAARWAMENELIPDLNDEGTAPEEMKFYPDNAVSKIDVLKAWQKAQELKQNA